MAVTAQDRDILRELALRAAEIGNDPLRQERAELWRRHNDLGAAAGVSALTRNGKEMNR